MKKLITACCLLSAIIISQNTSAQKLGEPCCGILSIGTVDGIVLVRNNTTGRTFMFKSDSLDINNLHVGDAINADMLSNKITTIKGIEKGYPINEPNPGQPCCGVTNIQPDPAQPCCGIVSIRNNGHTYSFSVPKNISSTLKVGQPVSLVMQNSYALFRTNINGTMSAYSYPVQNSPGENTGMGNNNGAWDIQLDAKIKGIGGEITMQLPKGLAYHTHMQFYDAGDTKKQLASWFGNNKARLLPGLYDIVVDGKYTIKNVPVELGKQTRLKMGVLKVSNYGSFEIENSSHQKFIYAPPFSIVLPEGTYYIIGKKKTPIVIKDSELTEL
jgi:hypothetical protein